MSQLPMPQQDTHPAPVLHTSAPQGFGLEVEAVREQVNYVQKVMKSVMHEGTHYGKIPGCGPKPALLKAGAEKLCLAFNLAAKFAIECRDMTGGHREYEITCTLVNRDNGRFIAEGVGCCSTRESKYRYRSGKGTATDKPVPQQYWGLKKTDPRAAQELLGGKGCGTAKNDVNQWVITEGGGSKEENEDIADCYNTVKKMAKKRAHVDAAITATAASDIFTQDIEEITLPTAPAPRIAPKAPAPTNTPPVSAPTQQQAPTPPAAAAPAPAATGTGGGAGRASKWTKVIITRIERDAKVGDGWALSNVYYMAHGSNEEVKAGLFDTGSKIEYLESHNGDGWAVGIEIKPNKNPKYGPNIVDVYIPEVKPEAAPAPEPAADDYPEPGSLQNTPEPGSFEPEENVVGEVVDAATGEVISTPW